MDTNCDVIYRCLLLGPFSALLTLKKNNNNFEISSSQSLIQVKISRRVNKYTILTTEQEEIHFTGPIKTNDKGIITLYKLK